MKKPSVSQLLDLLNKPRLIDWANKIGLQGISVGEFRKNKLAAGTNIHNQIKRFLVDGEMMSNEDNSLRLTNMLEGYSVIGIEQDIETEYFIGRYDIKLEREGNTFICDFKSNHTKHYLENYLQLAAYNMSERCTDAGIISVPSFTYMPISMDKFKLYESILINLSNIYKIKSEL